MAESAVSFALEQLNVLLREERQLLGGLGREVEYIQNEMAQMREFLRIADAKEDTNSGLKECFRQLREICHDIEDVLDEYMLQFGGRDDGNGFSGRIKKAYASIKNLKARHQIASEIQAIKHRLDSVSASQKRYQDMYAAIDQGSSSTVPTKNEWYDGRGDALFLEDTDVVGIEGPKRKLLEWIGSRADGLEVISVVGMGGLGKTTLVKKVYDDESVKKYFDRHVWIAVSDYKEVKDMLASLIKKLVGEFKESPPPEELGSMSVDDMRSFIFYFLRKGKYIIVLDDVWDTSTWEIIKFALPKRGTHGCIIITTRSISIANASCYETDHVYELKPLPEEESRELFYKKAFPRSSCPPEYLIEFAENILKKCEGLPLAIAVIGGLIATKKDDIEEWKKINRRLGDELDEGGNLKRLGKLFSLSYNDLPYYLKYCFLYLSIYPGSSLLFKMQIIRYWTAEGFVLSNRYSTMEEVGDDYVNQLVSRSLIQVAMRSADGEVWAFRIHDLVREYITVKSREHNMITVCDGGEMQWPNKTRRIAIHKFTNLPMGTNKFDSLRSLVLSCSINEEECGTINKLIGKCRLLRVLDLEGAPLETIPSDVFKLYHLKCLRLKNTKIRVIPSSIKYLVNLETINLAHCNVRELPVEILRLRKLQQLIVFTRKSNTTFPGLQGVKIPFDKGNWLLSLETLYYVNADEVEMVKEIGKLTQLRELGIVKLRSEYGQELCSYIANLTNLRVLHIRSAEKLDLDYSPISLPSLRILDLEGCLDKTPEWIPSLNCLTKLCLRWSKLREDPLNSLKDLPNLAYLLIHGADMEGLSFKNHGFLKLKDLLLHELKCLKWVTVEKGIPQGIEHLTNLQPVCFNNMKNEFLEGVGNEKRNERDKWRLSQIPNLRFFNPMDDGTWKLQHV